MTFRSVRRAAPIAAAFLLSVWASHAVLLAVDAKKAEYVGGTIAGLKEKAEGKFSTASDDALVFNSIDGSVSIPYNSVTSLEYGQKAGRRVGVAIMISPLALFSKKRKHFFTITYKDKVGKEQAGVFELGKDIVRTTLKIVEVRTGKEIEFQDLEACKEYKTPKDCQATK
jgi:hypothetical protein